MAAKMVKGGDEFSAMLNNLAGDACITVMKAACYAGVGVLADAVKTEIQGLPVESGYMKTGHKRKVVGTHDKKALQEHLGVSHITYSGGKTSVAVGFNGYNDRPTKKYPQGVPVPLIARALESGSSVREKNPFIRRAYNNAKTKAQEAAIDAGQTKLNELIK